MGKQWCPMGVQMQLESVSLSGQGMLQVRTHNQEEYGLAQGRVLEVAYSGNPNQAEELSLEPGSGRSPPLLPLCPQKPGVGDAAEWSYFLF